MKPNTAKKGISIIVCCYNSVKRLPETLKHLAKQECPPAIALEVIVVDNASTDGTAAMANLLWQYYGDSRMSFRIVEEKKPGLTNARNKGVAEASHDYLLFCDDDNWLSSNYAQEVYRILESHPEVAACGGEAIASFEVSPPVWFTEYQEAYAIGPQNIATEDGKILHLYGAGLGIDKNKLRELREIKFVSYLQDRVGNSLSSAGDTELSYALVLLGYKLHFAKELNFRHFIPKERLRMNYLRKLFAAFGNDGPIRNLYYSYISNRPLHSKIKSWNIHMALSLGRLIKYLILPPKKNGRIIYLVWNVSYIKSLFKIRASYTKLKANIELITTRPEFTKQQEKQLSAKILTSS